jgi:uncharacterized protein YwqG
MQIDDILRELQPWRDQYQRPAWRPRVVDGEHALTASKFGGLPWLALGEHWPACGHCESSMSLLLQLNLDHLPSGLDACFGVARQTPLPELAQWPLNLPPLPPLAQHFSSMGLLQIFYCLQCDDGWAPFAASQLARVVHPAGFTPEPSVPPDAALFPAKIITGWNEFTDWPNPQEHEELGLRYTYDFSANTVRLNCPEVGLTTECGLDDEELAETISTAAYKDKLGGWPAWVQGVEYPSCPRCQRRMALLFQLDSNDHLPFMFGDMGTGHVTQCPEHRAIVAFGWACG